VIEKLTGIPYETHVRKDLLAPLGIHDTQLGQTQLQAKDEVRYYDEKGKTGPSVFPADLKRPVPTPYGVWSLESLDAVGGWISSAPNLVRFASAFDHPEMSKLLDANMLEELVAARG